MPFLYSFYIILAYLKILIYVVLISRGTRLASCPTMGGGITLVNAALLPLSSLSPMYTCIQWLMPHGRLFTFFVMS